MTSRTERTSRARTRSQAARRFVFGILTLAILVIVAMRLNEAWYYYQSQITLVAQMQRQQTQAMAVLIRRSIEEIEKQMEWIVQLPWDDGAPDEWQFDSARLLRQVPAITEFSRIDAAGVERARASRVASSSVESRADRSRDPGFVQARTQNRYRGPVYFLRGSEPYVTLAVAGPRPENGVVVAEVNLKFISQSIADTNVVGQDTAFLVDAEGRLIAHPDISLVLRNIDLSHLSFIRSSIARSASREKSTADDQRFVLHANIESLGWSLFICLKQPVPPSPLHLLRLIGKPWPPWPGTVTPVTFCKLSVEAEQT